MMYTPAMEAVEKVRGRPLRQDILDLYVQHRDLQKVGEVLGEVLGASRTTLWYWRTRLGITDVDLQVALLEKKQQEVRHD